MPIIRKFNDGVFRPDQERLIKQGDLRDMCAGWCSNCQHTWWAPVIVRCPKCKSDRTVVTERKLTGAPRA